MCAQIAQFYYICAQMKRAIISRCLNRFDSFENYKQGVVVYLFIRDSNV